MVFLILWFIAAFLVVSGIIKAAHGEIPLGIALIILGCLVGPGGVSLFS